MELILVAVFVLGYLAIVFEHNININKSAPALLTGTLIWGLISLTHSNHELLEGELLDHLGEIAGILFFLMGAMTIVELVDTFHGFDIITDYINTTNPKKLLWIISVTTFFLSAVLDNLTTTIVMVTLLRKLIPHINDRKVFIGIVIIAANAGGAFSPIGDVTTTMLWIGGQITTFSIIKSTFIPSVVCLVVPVLILSFRLNPKMELHKIESTNTENIGFEKNLVFMLGIGGLLFVPVFKTVTHTPPYMGILFVLSIMWLITELLSHKKPPEKKLRYSIYHAFEKLDLPTILFFLGILLAVAGLQAAGFLHHAALWLDSTLKNQNLIVTVIGLLSSIVDNVPLVAASMGMYSIEHFPVDDNFWKLMAFCAGTGGSCLIIGSAAGVAAMGMEKIDFNWYLKNISLLALLGYFAGIGTFLLLN